MQAFTEMSNLPSIGKPALDARGHKSTFLPASSSSNRLGSENPYHLPGIEQIAAANKTIAELQIELVRAERQKKLGENKIVEENRATQNDMIKYARMIRVGKKFEGLWQKGQISATKASRLSGYSQQMLLVIANRLHNDEEPFPNNGRRSRAVDNVPFIEYCANNVSIQERKGQCLREVPRTQGNKTAIPGSKSSLGTIPGTTSEFFMRSFKEFTAKYFPEDLPVQLQSPLSPYEIKKLTDEILPEVVVSKKSDRRNARRSQSHADGYNYTSGVAGLICLWHLKNLDMMSQTDIESASKELGYDADQIINLDKSCAQPDNQASRDTIRVTKGITVAS